jgi:hypothetical protein
VQSEIDGPGIEALAVPAIGAALEHHVVADVDGVITVDRDVAAEGDGSNWPLTTTL